MSVTARYMPATMRRVSQALEERPRIAYVALRRAFEAFGDSHRDAMLARFSSTTNDSLTSRTGRLRGSINSRVTGTSLATLKLTQSVDGPIYAHIHEFGGDIVPVNAKFLAVPMPGNKTAAGVARYPSPREFIEQHPKEVRFVPTPNAPKARFVIVWQKPTGAVRKSAGRKKGEGVALWALVDRVTIRPRLGFVRTWHALRPERLRMLQEVARALGDSARG